MKTFDPEVLIARLKSGELEMVYNRQDTGKAEIYCTLKPRESGIYQGNVIAKGKVIGQQG